MRRLTVISSAVYLAGCVAMSILGDSTIFPIAELLIVFWAGVFGLGRWFARGDAQFLTRFLETTLQANPVTRGS
jgi:hypothetical protein